MHCGHAQRALTKAAGRDCTCLEEQDFRPPAAWELMSYRLHGPEDNEQAFISPDLHLEHAQNIANCYGAFNSNCVHEELPRIFCFFSNMVSYILILVKGSSQPFHSPYLLTFKGPL